jgi:very-short-patch-repair endonuclease
VHRLAWLARAQLRACGLGDGAITTMGRSGALVRHGYGVYPVRGAPASYAARLWLACLATNGVLGFATAAHLWGMVDDRPPAIHIVLPSGATGRGPRGVRTHRTHLPVGAVARRDGLPVCERTWALLDYLPALPPGAAARLLDRGIQQGWLAPGDLTTRVREFPGRTGNVALRRLAALTTDGAASALERRFHQLLRRAAVRGWRANAAVWHEGELIAVVDVAFMELRLAVELDGMAYHVDPARFQRDRERQNRLVALGWTVVRFTWADVTQRPDTVIATLRRIMSGFRTRLPATAADQV